MNSRLVSNFRRSLSFPNHQASPSSPSKQLKSFHVRSTSLPCRSHPLISHLHDELSKLTSWGSHPPNPLNSAWLCEGLSRLRAVHEYLDDLLQLPQTQDSLRHRADFVDKILEDFLRFIDVFGTFQGLILSLKHENSAAQMALRRKDGSNVYQFLKNLKNIGKEMGDLAISAVRYTTKRRPQIADADLEDAIRGVMEATVMVSVSLFSSIAMPLARDERASFGRVRLLRGQKEDGGIQELEQMKKMEVLRGLRDEEVRVMVLRSMQAVEGCVGEIERGSERVFRGLINTRVSLLNVLTNNFVKET